MFISHFNSIKSIEKYIYRQQEDISPTTSGVNGHGLQEIPKSQVTGRINALGVLFLMSQSEVLPSGLWHVEATRFPPNGQVKVNMKAYKLLFILYV